MITIRIGAALLMNVHFGRDPKQHTRGQVFNYLRRKGIDVLAYV